ncbi:MAG: squalene/phytoene synthase family protein, partial [Alphaproteobacteria bacterium]
IEVMIEARRLELYHQPVATFDELTCYFADTLGTAFSLGCQVLEKDPAPRTALCAQAGLVLGLTRLITELAAGPLAAGSLGKLPRLVPGEFLAKAGGGDISGQQNITPQVQGRLIAELIGVARDALGCLEGHLKNAPKALVPVFLPLVLVAADLARFERCAASTGKFVSELPAFRRVIKLASHGLRGRLV